VIGLVTLVVGKPVWSAKLPFGPYLAFGALTWMFFGETVLRWYGTLLSPECNCVLRLTCNELAR
jgi:ABC-type polysaccharide/polyol phosphate export permease